MLSHIVLGVAMSIDHVRPKLGGRIDRIFEIWRQLGEQNENIRDFWPCRSGPCNERHRATVLPCFRFCIPEKQHNNVPDDAELKRS